MESAAINLCRKWGLPGGILSVALSGVNQWKGHHQEGQGHSTPDRLSISATFDSLVQGNKDYGVSGWSAQLGSPGTGGKSEFSFCKQLGGHSCVTTLGFPLFAW